jgi:hypothetical protein
MGAQGLANADVQSLIVKRSRTLLSAPKGEADTCTFGSANPRETIQSEERAGTEQCGKQRRPIECRSRSNLDRTSLSMDFRY